MGMTAYGYGTFTALQRAPKLVAMGGQPTLRSLLAWAGAQIQAETPNLEHSVSLTDDGGAPAMKPAAAHYLGLAGQDSRPDDWRRAACKLDKDGLYRTPLRCAIEGIAPAERKLLLRDVLANVLFPSDVCEAHGIPRWAAPDVLYRSLSILLASYRTKPTPERGWISGRSDSQRSAEDAA